MAKDKSISLWSIFTEVIIKGKAERLPRKPFWILWLCNLLPYFLILFLGYITADIAPLSFIMFLMMIFIIAINIRMMIYRLHDTGHSGAYCFVSLIPVIGGLILLFALLDPTENKINDYGPPLNRIKFDIAKKH